MEVRDSAPKAPTILELRCPSPHCPSTLSDDGDKSYRFLARSIGTNVSMLVCASALSEVDVLRFAIGLFENHANSLATYVAGTLRHEKPA